MKKKQLNNKQLNNKQLSHNWMGTNQMGIMGISRRKKKKKGYSLKHVFLFLVFSSVVLVAAIFAFRYISDTYIVELGDPLPHFDVVKRNAEKYDLEIALIYGVIRTESSFRENVVSPVGAIGLMQIMPDTGAWIAERKGIENFTEDMLFDVETNIAFGSYYIRFLKSRETLNFGKNEDVIFAAYNAGQTRVARWLQDSQYSRDGITLHYIPFTETRNYVERVNANRERYRKILRRQGLID